MKNKIVCIFLITLLIIVVLPVSGTINVTHDLEITGENDIYNINNHRGFYSDDFFLDIVITNDYVKTLTVLIGKKFGEFDYGGEIEAGYNTFGITTDDFNMDGFLDLAVTHNDDDKVSIFIGDGLGGFELLERITVGEGPVDIVTGLFNDDEFIDLAVVNHYSNDVSVLLGDGMGGFGVSQEYSVELRPYALITEDFNGDGNLDIATAHYGAYCVCILLGDGLGGFEDYQEYQVIGSGMDLVAGDFNKDTILDLAVAIWFYGIGGKVSILLGDGDGGFGEPDDNFLGESCIPRQIVTNDFNGDGNLDLVNTNQFVNSISILLGDGTGEFGTPEFLLTGLCPIDIVSTDFNRDNNADFAVTCHDDTGILVYFGDGDGGFGFPYGFAYEYCPNFFVIGDFNPKTPPDAPIVEGPSQGKAGEEYCWMFHSDDPNGDDIMYIIDWGDGETTETECYSSGEDVEECHTYNAQGTYTIKAKAKECTEDGLESDWATLTVTMPRNRAINGFFLRFLEQFPILRKMLLLQG
jgi:hypothetical protein